MATFATYDFPTHERGTSFEGLQFELLVNGVAKSLVGATINMKIGSRVFSTTTGELVFSDAANGKFQFKKQVVTLSVKRHDYEMEFIFSDGSIKVYLKGTWRIIN